MRISQFISACAICLALASARAQFGAGLATGGASFSKSTAKLFGENTNFSANMEFQIHADSTQGGIAVPARITFSEGKSRFEMDTTEAKAASLQAGTGSKLKSLGMNKMIVISRPDKKLSYTIYPGWHVYVETPMEGPDTEKSERDFKMESTAVGKQAMAGYDCVKNTVVVTDKDGSRYDSTVWNAADLNKFPVRIEQTQGNSLVTMTFTDVRFFKPDATLFEPPVNYKKYDSMNSVIQDMMMEKGDGTK